MTAFLKNIHPVLPVKNVLKALNYYIQELNFELAFKDEGDDPKYAGVKRNAIEIHLQWHDEKEWLAGIDRPLLRIYVEDVEALFEEYQSKSVFHKSTRLRKTAWRTQEFGFYDIYGNGLIFYRDLLIIPRVPL